MDIFNVFLLGFFIKIITGFDDMITRIPVISAITRTRRGKVAFSIGVVLAVSAATAIAYAFSSFLDELPHYRSIVAGLIFLLAVCIYFDIFVHDPRSKAEPKVKEKAKQISSERFTQLVAIGFVASFATVLDDVIAYLPIFLLEPFKIAVGVAGILTATVVQALLVIYFSEKIDRLPYKEEVASLGLVVLGILLLAGVL